MNELEFQNILKGKGIEVSERQLMKCWWNGMRS